MTGTADALAPRVLAVDVDGPLLGLLEQWLEGCEVLASPGGGPVDLVIADLPYPRQAGERLQALAAAHPGVPILALSSSFLGEIPGGGALARSLGVAGALAKPVTQAALLAAVRRLLPAA